MGIREEKNVWNKIDLNLSDERVSRGNTEIYKTGNMAYRVGKYGSKVLFRNDVKTCLADWL